MNKVLVVELGFVLEEKRKIIFRMTVPASVSPENRRLIVHAPPGLLKMFMNVGRFDPVTDGTVEVEGHTPSHSFDEALELLQRHPAVHPNIQVINS